MLLDLYTFGGRLLVKALISLIILLRSMEKANMALVTSRRSDKCFGKASFLTDTAISVFMICHRLKRSHSFYYGLLL